MDSFMRRPRAYWDPNAGAIGVLSKRRDHRRIVVYIRDTSGKWHRKEHSFLGDLSGCDIGPKGIRCLATVRGTTRVYSSSVDSLNFEEIDRESFNYVQCGENWWELKSAKYICWPADATVGYYDVGHYIVSWDPCYTNEYWFTRPTSRLT